MIPFDCPEFTSLCPKTGQPDFAQIHINYIPNNKCVESKSLKLYLFSFRSSGEFMEDITNRIAKDLEQVLDPLYLEVYADFNPRGGIALRPYVSWFNPMVVNTVLKEIKTVIYDWRATRKLY